jgi:hypothetical protein
MFNSFLTLSLERELPVIVKLALSGFTKKGSFSVSSSAVGIVAKGRCLPAMTRVQVFKISERKLKSPRFTGAMVVPLGPYDSQAKWSLVWANS